MALIEAVLTYNPGGLGLDVPPIPLGKTPHRRVLRVLRDCLVEEAEAAVRMWQDIDPGIAALHQAEADRLRRVLGWLLPDDRPKPSLRVVRPKPSSHESPVPSSDSAGESDNTSARP